VRQEARFPFRVEPLGDQHARAAFRCGTEALDRSLHRQARQDQERRVAVIHVAVPLDQATVVAAFYTLSATAVRLQSVPAEVAKKLPRYPDVPATLLGRLAVGQDHQRHGLGEHLLIDALRRSMHASRTIGSVAVIVDAKDDRAKGFYLHYGFIPLPEQPARLFLPMKTIERLFGGR
jgi:GNAT superfamily N-acetyltransferase